MSYISDWKEAEEQDAKARAANPLCDESLTCPAPDNGHLVGCKFNRKRLGLGKYVRILPEQKTQLLCRIRPRSIWMK